MIPIEKRVYKGLEYYGGDLCIGDPTHDKASQLILKKYSPQGKKVLMIDPGSGALLAHCIQAHCTVTVSSSLFHEHYACEKTKELLQRSCSCIVEDLVSARLTITEERLFFRLNKSFEYSLSVIRHILSHAKSGVLVLYGTNDEGAKSLLKKISQHGIQGECTEIGSSSRIFEIDIAAQNSTGLGNAQRDVPYDVTVSGARFSYDTWPGVFSQKKVDEGSQLLMESIPDLSGKSVLDLGCGAGILAMQAFNMGAERVHCRDVNAISTACTLHNLSAFGAKATVSCGYITEGVTEKFEVIVTNPPFHMGTQTHFDIGKEWLEGCSAALKPGGAIYLVANEFLRYSDFCKKLGFKVEKLATSPRFFVYKIVS